MIGIKEIGRFPPNRIWKYLKENAVQSDRGEDKALKHLDVSLYFILYMSEMTPIKLEFGIKISVFNSYWGKDNDFSHSTSILLRGQHISTLQNISIHHDNKEALIIQIVSLDF